MSIKIKWYNPVNFWQYLTHLTWPINLQQKCPFFSFRRHTYAHTSFCFKLKKENKLFRWCCCCCCCCCCYWCSQTDNSKQESEIVHVCLCVCVCVCDERRNVANFSVQKKRPSVVVVVVDVVVVVAVKVYFKFISHISLKWVSLLNLGNKSYFFLTFWFSYF